MTRRRDESNLLTAILLECGSGATRLFRNNCGMLQDRNGQHIRYGVCNPGGSDLIGWTKVTVTPDMVGQTLAVFTAVETKTATGRVTPEQERFLQAVAGAGGRSGVARSVADAAGIIANKRNSGGTP